MPHQPTQIVIHTLTELAAQGAWTPTAHFADLLPEVGRATIARVLDELMRRYWVIGRQQRGASYFIAGPALQPLGVQWRTLWAQQAEHLIEMLDMQPASRIARAPMRLGAPSPMTLLGEPTHAGTSQVCDLLVGMVGHPAWVSTTDLAEMAHMHRQTADEILGTLRINDWVEQVGNEWVLTNRFPSLCLSQAMTVAHRIQSTQQQLRASVDALAWSAP